MPNLRDANDIMFNGTPANRATLNGVVVWERSVTPPPTGETFDSTDWTGGVSIAPTGVISATQGNSRIVPVINTDNFQPIGTAAGRFVNVTIGVPNDPAAWTNAGLNITFNVAVEQPAQETFTFADGADVDSFRWVNETIDGVASVRASITLLGGATINNWLPETHARELSDSLRSTVLTLNVPAGFFNHPGTVQQTLSATVTGTNPPADEGELINFNPSLAGDLPATGVTNGTHGISVSVNGREDEDIGQWAITATGPINIARNGSGDRTSVSWSLPANDTLNRITGVITLSNSSGDVLNRYNYSQAARTEERNTYSDWTNSGAPYGGTEDGGNPGPWGAYSTVATVSSQMFANESRTRVVVYTTTGRQQDQIRTCTAQDGCDGPFTRTIGAPNSTRNEIETQTRVSTTPNPAYTFTFADGYVEGSGMINANGIPSAQAMNGATVDRFGVDPYDTSCNSITRGLQIFLEVPAGYANGEETVDSTITVTQPGFGQDAVMGMLEEVEGSLTDIPADGGSGRYSIDVGTAGSWIVNSTGGIDASRSGCGSRDSVGWSIGANAGGPRQGAIILVNEAGTELARLVWNQLGEPNTLGNAFLTGPTTGTAGTNVTINATVDSQTGPDDIDWNWATAQPVIAGGGPNDTFITITLTADPDSLFNLNSVSISPTKGGVNAENIFALHFITVQI